MFNRKNPINFKRFSAPWPINCLSHVAFLEQCVALSVFRMALGRVNSLLFNHLTLFLFCVSVTVWLVPADWFQSRRTLVAVKAQHSVNIGDP